MNEEDRGIYQNELNNNYIIEEPLGFEPDEHGLGYLFFNSMKKYENNVAQYLADTSEEDLYRDFLKRSVRTALGLRKRNLTKNDVVLLCSYSHKNTAVPFIASILLGVKVASLDPILSLMDTTYLIAEVKPKVIFIVPEVLEMTEAALEKTGISAEIVVYDDLGSAEGHTRFSDFLEFDEEEDDFVPEDATSPHETAVIFFSSGTTGYPKGIETSHYALACQSRTYIKTGNFGNIAISYTSLYWISGVITITSTTLHGFSRVICRTFNATKFWTNIDKYRVTTMFVAPVQVVDIIKSGRPDGVDTTSLISCLVGGASISKNYILELRDLLPGTFVSMAYGQTEVAGVITVFQARRVSDTIALHYKPESVGKVNPGLMCKVVDPESEKLCGPHEDGELRVKTDMVMNGYYGRDSSESFDDEGWLKTGDIVHYDEEKCFFIVDRIKEMLKYKSWHVAPAMVEKIVLDHPAVRRAVVIGIPHDEDGDHPMAVIVLHPEVSQYVTEEDIKEFVAGKAPDRMKLRGGVKFVSSIPITPSGKMKRKTVRDMVLKELV